MSVYVTKGRLWDLLGDDALKFSIWLNSGELEATAIKTMLENTDGVDLTSPLVQGELLPLLQSKSVISQATIDTINQYIVNYVPQEQGVTYTVNIKAMADITPQNPWGMVQRDWGWEVRVDFINNDTGEIYNEVLTFPTEPTQADIDKAITERLMDIRRRV